MRQRLLALAAAVVRLLPILGEHLAARSLVKHLERCGPAGGANYKEARGAESPADFTHKVRIPLKEVRETRYWLRLILKAELLDCPHKLARLIDESGELIAILKIYANPIFYQRLVNDIIDNLAVLMLGIVVVLVLAWLTSNRLLASLREREQSLVLEVA